MAQYTRIEVFEQIRESGVVPLFYHSNIDIAKKTLKACYDGGIRLLEFTNRGDFAIEIFSDLIKYSIQELPGMILGVGSITDASSASQYILNGANFVITPVFRKDVAIICNRRKVFWSAGCGSLTEIAEAEENGCEIIKLFPAGTYGPDFVKAIKGPQPWTHLMPTGGVSIDEHNLRSWFDSGVISVGIGSKLISHEILNNQDFDSLKIKTNSLLEIIKKVRSK